MTAKGDPVVFQGLQPGGAEGVFGYTVPNLLIDHAMHNPHVRPGYWRGVNLNQNALYCECFIDELAHAAGSDPLPSGAGSWQPSPSTSPCWRPRRGHRLGDQQPPEGVHRGIAQVMGFGSYVAAAAEVSVTGGKLKIHRIVAATDPGHVLNPQQIEAQISGSFVYGLSAMLYGECTVKDGRIEQENFDTYNVMRIDEMPAVESDHDAVGRLLGRRRGADDRRRRACGAQCRLRGDRQAGPKPSAEERRSALELTWMPGGDRGNRGRPFCKRLIHRSRRPSRGCGSDQSIGRCPIGLPAFSYARRNAE